MMRFREDTGGNFVEQFLAIGFDAHVRELDLWAAFNDTDHARRPDVAVPDLAPSGALAACHPLTYVSSVRHSIMEGAIRIERQ